MSAYVDLCSDVFQIPHAFQQILSGEMTPTLGMSLAAFKVMAAKWKKHCDAHPEFADVIDAGLDKLDEYYNYAQDVPANTIAMGKTARKLFLCNMLTNNVTVLNPAAKLNWLCTNAPSQVEDVRQVVLTVVCQTIQCSYSCHYAHHYHSLHCTIDHRQVVPAILSQVAHKLVACGHMIFLALACQLLMTSQALKMSLTATLLNHWYIAVLYIIGRYVIKQWSLEKVLKKIPYPRRTKPAIQPSSILQWTSFQSKAQLCHARGSFRLPKRP